MLSLSKEPLTRPRKEPLTCLQTAGTPPWHNLGKVGVQGQLCLQQMPQHGAGLSVTSPALSWGSTGATVLGSDNVQHCVPCCVVAGEEMSSTEAVVPAAHSPSLVPSPQVQELDRAALSIPK